MSKIIGIDLGSTLSEVAVMEGNQPVIVVNEEGGRTTPSVISFNESGERKIGSAAKRQMLTNPKGTVNLIKRFMGGTYDEVKDNITHIQYDVVNNAGYPRVKINDREYSPEELSSMILSKMKKIAEDYLGETVTDAVITVPAYFNDAQREATKKAGEIAGLNVRRIVAEPTAAILASNIDMAKGGKYMVVDYGGSTTDFSVADISDNVVEILASNGDVYCGGSDIDKIVGDFIVEEFKKQCGVDITGDAMAMSRVLEAAEKAKMDLSSSPSTEINLPYLYQTNHLVTTLTKARFEQLIKGEIDKVVSLGREALNKANVKDEDLNGILLVGGSTRIPMLQEALTKEFNRPLIKSANVDEIVALGAAVQGSIISGEKTDVLLLDVTPLALGIETMTGVMAKIIDANTTIPCKRSEVFSTASDNQTAVTILVAQGNRPLTKDNKQIGIFNLDGIPPAMHGIPQIEVTFDIDSNGILSVSAKDKGTGKEQHITIESKSSLTEEDIERMKKEAEEHEEEDRKAILVIENLNNSEQFANSVENTLSSLKEDQITEDEKAKITEAVANLRDVISKKDTEHLDEKVSKLQTLWNPIVEKLYKKDQPQGGETTIDPNMFANMFANTGQQGPSAPVNEAPKQKSTSKKKNKTTDESQEEPKK